MKIRNDVISLVLATIRVLQAYEHPRSRCGVRQDTAIKFMQLARALETAERDFVDSYNNLVIRYGEKKDPTNEKSWYVPQDSPHRIAFASDRDDLYRTEIEVTDRLCIKLSELKVRDENGELVELESGRIGNLGPLLIVDAAQPEVKSGDVRRRIRTV